jgi:hypothetical protein
MKSFVFPVIQRALIGAESLPPAERADLYQGIAQCLAAEFPSESLVAQKTAEQIREAETLQRQFLDFLA